MRTTMETRSSTSLLLISLIFSFLSALIVPSTALGFTCINTTTTSCESLIDYIPPNDTTLVSISSLFGVTNFYSLLGANLFSLSTPSSQSFAANDTIRIPFPCSCSNGSGISDKVPMYTVKSGDSLDSIATNVYSRLVTYQEIAQVNNISDPSLIDIGQNLWIPLPCSCDKVNGNSIVENQVVHYGHLVAKGSSVDQIAMEYGIDANTLSELNGISNANQLQAGQLLDVPLTVCDSVVGKGSEDYPLLVANGTYALTAYNCIQCKCQPNIYISNITMVLQCEPSQGVKPSNISQCPSMECSNSGLLIGQTSNCKVCDYAGYVNTTILTSYDSFSTSNCSVLVKGLAGSAEASKVATMCFSAFGREIGFGIPRFGGGSALRQ
ncbi:hypothetical protein NE237_024388 [Protea cynaroides]|uniref:LysM domain-containing protein n=1 Tax=Protea cynaroides TaxID=273540 RepID=A0A9Q0HIG4_9MAGN|nr:hypothetical protein NE237_024388 [Protea cynaroides]